MKDETSGPTISGAMRALNDGVSWAEVHVAIDALGFSREALLAGIDPRVVGGLSTASVPSAQRLMDLEALKRMGTLRDGSEPLRIYLMNALSMAGLRREAAVFKAALASI